MICPSGTDPGRPTTSGSPAGNRTGPGRSRIPSRSATMRWAGGVDRRHRLHGQPAHQHAAGVRKGGVDRDEREDPSRAQTRQALSRSLAGHLTAAGSDHPWTHVRFTAFWISRNPLEPVLVVPTRRGNQRRRGTGPHRVAPPAASRTAPPRRHRSRCPAVRRDAVAAQGGVHRSSYAARLLFTSLSGENSVIM